MLNRFRSLFLGATAAALAATAAFAQEKLTFAHVYEVDSAYNQWAQWAADEIGKRTDGRVTVENFPAASLGNENDIFQGLSLGTVDITLSGSFYAGQLYPPMSLSSAPYMYRDFDHWLKYSKSDLFEEISSEYTEQSGRHVLGLIYYGARHLTANREINSPEDMAGMKLRVPNSPMFTLFPRSVGANATPIQFAEVYLALQQGVVDGQENPLPTIVFKKFYEVQSHVMLTGHLMDSLVVEMGDPAWQRLSEEDRAIVAEVLGEMADNATQAVRESEMELAQSMPEKYGVTLVEIDRAPFVEAMKPLLEADDLPWTKEHVARVQAIK
ncbi:sialic acid TRAP transporter substrate-binding protein SiaP [uncultured Marivita sp.]|uniref:sialic acid TRAP transporter substrate-binding protein SiaP n=1 Tax=uncultured Marivita sp. TaxID=888080 RepID=UPI0026319F95|nr:sialic acid TRAP transporter substrate-binding protein SiaP [uncultured Marivita sp.]